MVWPKLLIKTNKIKLQFCKHECNGLSKPLNLDFQKLLKNLWLPQSTI